MPKEVEGRAWVTVVGSGFHTLHSTTYSSSSTDAHGGTKRIPSRIASKCSRAFANPFATVGHRPDGRRYVVMGFGVLLLWATVLTLAWPLLALEFKLSRKREREVSLEPVATPSSSQVRCLSYFSASPQSPNSLFNSSPSFMYDSCSLNVDLVYL
jgi:hypothetical protein